jgi:hypothetical protein
MIIAIPTEAELYAQQLALEVENKPIVALLKAMQRYYTTTPFAEASLEIHLNPNVLDQESSYRVNPSMLARNSNLGIFVYCRAKLVEGTIVILYTNNSDEGVNFFARLKDFLLTNTHEEALDVPFEEVPESYRYKPELLRYRVMKAIGVKLITRKTKTSWIYRRAKNQ